MSDTPAYLKDIFDKVIMLDIFRSDPGYRSEDKGLEDRYTPDQRKMFYMFLYQEHKIDVDKNLQSESHIDVSTGNSWMFSMSAHKHREDVSTKDYPMNKHFLGEAYVLLEEPLEDMPIYINDKSYTKRAVSKWRLEIGK